MTADSIRVLCADDTDIAVEGMRRILESEPYIRLVGQVTRRTSVVQAVQELGPDVVLLDLKWGGIFEAGYDLIQQIKQAFPQVCIIAITVYEDLATGARRVGADDVVTKDISGEDLKARIKAVYTQARRQEHPIRLLELLIAHFDEGELRTLCFALRIDYDDLPDEGKANKARELIRYLERRGRISELITAGKQMRSEVPWPDVR